jgi:dTDP-4-dehydrorhamnose reductase
VEKSPEPTRSRRAFGLTLLKVLVFGRTGQVARELARRCPTDVEAIWLGREEADLSDPKNCGEAVSRGGVDAVINAAAWTAVDLAENEEPAATVVNGEAPGAMARACAKRGVPILHISTDYVFDGSKVGAYFPGDEVAPVSAYGRSKLFGEVSVRESGAKHLILRTSWVFSAHRSNFVKTMLRLGVERDTIEVVADQIGGPTPAEAIADALFVASRSLVHGQAGGTYHFAGMPEVSWAELARAVIDTAGLSCRIEDIPSSNYPTPAQRPLNSRLECSSFERDFGVRRPDWRNGLENILKELGVRS